MTKANFVKTLLTDQSGATAIEYGLIAALVSIAAITAMGALGNSISNTYNYVQSQESAASSGKI